MAGTLTLEPDQGEPAEAPTSDRAASGWSYRPHLDGLRAVAVYLVVLFHAGADRFSGGFIGVDVFFVLSGYLVTGLLLRDRAATGSVRLGRFYARRIRRLLPAATVNLLITAVIFRAIASPAELPSAVGSMRAAALYVSNWWFIRESADYFGTSIEASPVLQYWSLSVEEQFYVVWPLLLGGLALVAARFGRGHRRVLAGLVATVGALSLVVALVIERSDPSRAYFGTDTRVYQLLAGALLAIVPSLTTSAGRWGRRFPQVLGVVLLVALVLAGTDIVSISPVHRGVVAAALTVGLIVSLESAATGVARGALSLGPISYLGRISYSTYLWHWIVILVAVRQLEMAPLTTAAVAVGVATGLAALSYEVLERPIRTSTLLDRFTPAVIACGLGVSALVGFVLLPRILDVDGTVKVTADSAAAARTPDGGAPLQVDWREAAKQEPDTTPCKLGPSNVCVLTRGTGKKVLLVGESHAAMLAGPWKTVAERHDWTLAAAFLPYCPWPRGLEYTMFNPKCFQDQKALYEERIPRFDPDLVILVHRAVDDPKDPIGTADADVGPLYLPRQVQTAVDRRVRETVSSLRKDGREVILVEPIPVATPEETPIKCLAEKGRTDPCRFVATTGTRPEEETFRQLDQGDDGVWDLDLDRSVCPYFPICDPVVDGHIVLYDNHHLTTGFAATLADTLDRFVTENGIATRSG